MIFKRNNSVAERGFKQVGSYVVFKCDDYLMKVLASPSERHRRYIESVRTDRTTGLEEFRRRRVAEVVAACDSARRLEHAHLSKTKDTQILYSEEIQLYAFGTSIRRLSRARDILAAMEVAEPFERMVDDLDYLNAIVQRNVDEGDSSAGSMEITPYKDASGQEIAQRLMRQVETDMFDSEMWAKVSYFAGDQKFLEVFESFDTVLTTFAMKHWNKYYESINLDRRALRELLETIADAKTISKDEFVSWDRSLRELFRETQDTKVRRQAFEAWQALIETWKQAFVAGGNSDAASRLDELANDLKTRQLRIWEAKKITKRPEAGEIVGHQP